MLFPQAHSSITPATRFALLFHPRMATCTKADARHPSSLFWYADQIKWRPYNLLLNPSNREISDDTKASLPNFSYLVACLRSVLIFHSGHKIYAEVYRPARFGRQFGYHQHLPRVVASGPLKEVSLIEANSYWRECMRRLMGSSLVVPARYLVRNVTVAYARWWHTITGATCRAEHVTGLVLAPKRKAGP